MPFSSLGRPAAINPGGELLLRQGPGTYLTETEDRRPNRFSGRFLQRPDRFRNLVQCIRMFEVPRQMFGPRNQMFGARLRTNCPSSEHFIPFRHIPTLFDATDAELTALLALVREAKAHLDGRFHPDGYNVGVNVRAAAGRTLMHLIPRYAGDVADPRGGVRGVIPERQGY